jgi:hypothetical protein
MDINPQSLAADGRPLSRQAIARQLLPSLLEDVLLPYGTYRLLKHLGVQENIALAAGGGVSFIRVMINLARSRKLDLTALFMLLMFALTIVTSLATGHGRLSIATDSLYTGLAGIVLLGSLAWGRPLFYELAQQQVRAGRRADSASLRQHMTRVTTVWGVTLLSEAALRIALLLLLPVHIMRWGTNVLMGIVIASLFLWTRAYNRKAARQAVTAGNSD